MSYFAIFRCNTNSSHHTGINNYRTVPHESNFVKKQLSQTSAKVSAVSPRSQTLEPFCRVTEPNTAQSLNITIEIMIHYSVAICFNTNVLKVKQR